MTPTALAAGAQEQIMTVHEYVVTPRKGSGYRVVEVGQTSAHTAADWNAVLLWIANRHPERDFEPERDDRCPRCGSDVWVFEVED